MSQSGKPGGLQRSHQPAGSWSLRPGVTAGTWDYVRSGYVAGQYDVFLENDPLIEQDWRFISNYLPAVPSDMVVADFGTGTGRHVLNLLQHGCSKVLGVDLSVAMLGEAIGKVREKKSEFRSGQTFYPLLANLVELDGIASNSVDFAICMFSTLGMIRGKQNRQRFLDHAYRVLKPGSRFIVHAHNYWYQSRYPGGWKWMLGNGWQTLMGRAEIGDRQADYRSIRNLFIHSYRYREFGREMNNSGFRLIDTSSLIAGKREPRREGYWGDCFRTIGWLVACERVPS